jgi:hypothetical protein
MGKHMMQFELTFVNFNVITIDAGAPKGGAQPASLVGSL